MENQYVFNDSLVWIVVKLVLSRSPFMASATIRSCLSSRVMVASAVVVGSVMMSSLSCYRGHSGLANPSIRQSVLVRGDWAGLYQWSPTTGPRPGTGSVRHFLPGRKERINNLYNFR